MGVVLGWKGTGIEIKQWGLEKFLGWDSIDIKTLGTRKWARSWGGRVLTFKLNSGDWKRSWGGRVLTLILKQWGLESGHGLGVGGY